MSRWKASGPYVRMASGARIFLERASQGDIRIPDIIHHLARINRYTGASLYTVGQHSVVAARMASRFYPDHAMLPARMLIHDVSEHILGDVSSPLKSLLPEFQEIEARWEAAIEDRFGVTFVGVPEVKEIDDRMWLTERVRVYPGLGRDSDYAGDLVEFPLDRDEMDELFEPWSTEVVEAEFMVELRARLPWVV